jgi:hypothetical protein
MRSLAIALATIVAFVFTATAFAGERYECKIGDRHQRDMLNCP